MEGKKILIAEDDRPIGNALMLKLKREGFDVTLVGDGNAVIEALESSSFDLVLLDIIMPRKDGFATMTEIKEKGITVPVMVTSNLGQDEDVERMKSLGAVGYIIKTNTSLVDLVDTVKGFFKK